MFTAALSRAPVDQYAWRIVRDTYGVPVRTRRVWEGDTPAPKRLRRLFGSDRAESYPGSQLVPWCPQCGAQQVWRGRWECSGCTSRGGWQDGGDGSGTFEVPRALPASAAEGAPLFSSPEGNNSTGLGGWLSQVEAMTSFHRRATAARMRLRGTREAPEQVDVDGVVTRSEPYVSSWHQQRVDGQGERFDRVRQCGSYEYCLDVTAADGTVTSRPLRTRCDCWRVCTKCADRRRWKLSEGMRVSRARALRVYRRESTRVYRGKEGKWSEKLLTFTVPHSGDPASDARLLVGTWQKVLRRVKAHLQLRGAVRVLPSGKLAPASVPWCRALEVTPSGGGHAHMHVWYHGPYLDVVLLRVWWGQALLETAPERQLPFRKWGDIKKTPRDARVAKWLGNPSAEAEIPWPVVDIRAGSEAAAHYTQKVGISLYTVKSEGFNRLGAVHAARIYEVFEGTRAVQWASGWAPPKKPLAAKAIQFRRLTEAEKRELNLKEIRRRQPCESTSTAPCETPSQPPVDPPPVQVTPLRGLAPPPELEKTLLLPF